MLHITLGTEYARTGAMVAVKYFASAAVAQRWVAAGPKVGTGKKTEPLRFASTTTIPVCETVEEAG